MTSRLDARGSIVEEGTVVDATIVAALVERPPYNEAQVDPRDPDAGFIVGNDKTYFGYTTQMPRTRKATSSTRPSRPPTTSAAKR